MFGFNKKTKSNNVGDQGAQIPYQVYETVHEPSVQRRRWIIRLSTALVVATLLVLGGTAIWGGDGRGAQPAGEINPQVEQAPQAESSPSGPAAQSAKTPLSDATNDKIVEQPQ